MKEKTKQILRYVACGLGGLALGIGLLGGLSMCATSGNNQTESVNTIYASPKREQITTTDGGYTGYTFTLREQWGSIVGLMNWTVYDVDISTYTLTSYQSGASANLNSWDTLKPSIDTIYTTYQPSSNNELRFLACWGLPNWYSDGGRYLAYFTFILPNGQTWQYAPQTFIKTNWEYAYGIRYDQNAYSWLSTGKDSFYITYERSNIFLLDERVLTSEPVSSVIFQDVQSYYKSKGYSEGNTAGYSEGHTAGYSEGYDDAYEEKDSGIAFTSCGVYPNAQVTLATDETIGNFKYMYLCHYITKPGYDEHTIYIMWTTNANTGQYLGEVIDRNDTDSYDPAVTLGSFTQQATSSVTITATQDMEFGLWVGYITTFHNRGEITNSILWFQGGTSESDMQIYQNGYDEGFQNGNQAGQETGYEQGYDRGHEVGDAEGYSRGYTEGFNQTNTKNVFSLFTSAFDSVASFFDLKIFGFLPLYWFFLAPLFIALISLLMRMVKH